MNISGWRSDWRPAQEQLQRQAGPLLSLRGQRIVDAWIVWMLDRDEWFADLPVVLGFGDGRRLEIGWQKFDELSVSWNTIEVDTPPQAWVTSPLQWRSQAHPALRSVVGETVRAVEATQHLFTVWDPVTPADRTSTWLTSGVWLETEATGLHVFNALDENGLSNDPAADGPDLRRHPIRPAPTEAG